MTVMLLACAVVLGLGALATRSVTAMTGRAVLGELADLFGHRRAELRGLSETADES